MSWLFWGAAASGWTAAFGLVLILAARAGRRDTALALRLRALVEPYLLRRAQEMGMEAAGSPTTDRLEDVVSAVCGLAERLAAREREQFTETQRMAVAQTVPIDRPILDK